MNISDIHKMIHELDREACPKVPKLILIGKNQAGQIKSMCRYELSDEEKAEPRLFDGELHGIPVKVHPVLDDMVVPLYEGDLLLDLILGRETGFEPAR